MFVAFDVRGHGSDVFADVIYRFANHLTATTGSGRDAFGVSAEGQSTLRARYVHGVKRILSCGQARL